MNACVKHGVRFQWTLGVLFIPLSDIEIVLTELPSNVRVLGFDGFNLEGYKIYPSLEYLTEYGSGFTIAEALSDIAEWPRDKELWVETVITFK